MPLGVSLKIFLKGIGGSMVSARLFYLFLIGFVLSIIFFNPYVFASPPDNFTAIMVTEGIEVPMAKMGAKTRIENVGMKNIVTIVLNDTKKMITLNTDKKLYHEQPNKQPDQMVSYYDPDMVFEKKKIGTEKIGGYLCNKYDAIYYRKSKPGEKHKAVIWEATDLKDFPIKMEFNTPQGKKTIMYKDIKLGVAKASMFEVPKGYKKVNAVYEVMDIGTGTGMDKMEEMMKKMQKRQQ